MLGRRAKWILGTDHAGIATQKQVEKAVIAEGTSRQEMGREAFTERVWEWREQYGSTIVDQFKRIGASCDYSQERFTLDEGYERSVLEVFVRLFEKGLIYRDNYMVNWDPGSRSAISDLEVEEREVVDRMVEIGYPLADGSNVVAELAAQYQGKRYCEPYNNQYFDSFVNTDARLTWNNDNWTVTAYVDNLFDDDTIRSGFSQGDFFGLFSSPGSRSWVVIPPDPVRGGLRASYRF
jgi:hypothetical protein